MKTGGWSTGVRARHSIAIVHRTSGNLPFADRGRHLNEWIKHYDGKIVRSYDLCLNKVSSLTHDQEARFSTFATFFHLLATFSLDQIAPAATGKPK
jgi:hypothetical protein